MVGEGDKLHLLKAMNGTVPAKMGKMLGFRMSWRKGQG